MAVEKQSGDLEKIGTIVERVIKEHPLKVEEYKNGKKGIISMFMGEIKRRAEGRVDLRKASELVTKKLDEL